MTATANAQRPSPTPTTDSSRLRSGLRPFVGLVVPLLAVLAALFVGAVMLLALGANPFTGYVALVKGAVGGRDELADTAIKSMPLLLVGVGISIAFRAGVINIGGEGQIVAGAILSTILALAVPRLLVSCSCRSCSLPVRRVVGSGARSREH